MRLLPAAWRIVKSKQVSFRCPEGIAERIAAMVESSGKYRNNSEAFIHLIECGLEERLQLPGDLQERVRKHADFLARDERLFVQQAIEGMCDLLEGGKSASTLQLEYRFRQELLRGNTADLEARLGFAPSSDAKNSLDKLQFPAGRRPPSRSSAIYVQSVLANFIAEEGKEVPLRNLAYAYDLLVHRERLRPIIEGLAPAKARQWIEGYPEKPQAAHFLPALKDLVVRGIIRIDASTRIVRLVKERDGNAWAQVDAVLVRAALKESLGALQEDELQRVEHEMAPPRRMKELLAS